MTVNVIVQDDCEEQKTLSFEATDYEADCCHLVILDQDELIASFDAIAMSGWWVEGTEQQKVESAA